jgi:hypothetical protein
MQDWANVPTAAWRALNSVSFAGLWIRIRSRASYRINILTKRMESSNFQVNNSADWNCGFLVHPSLHMTLTLWSRIKGIHSPKKSYASKPENAAASDRLRANCHAKEDTSPAGPPVCINHQH